MTRRLTVLALIAMTGSSAHAEVDASVRWVPRPVRVVAADDVRPEAPHVPPGADRIGVVSIGGARVAALWLEPGERARVRADLGARLRFARVVGTAGSRAVIEDPGVAVEPGVWYVRQPLAEGGVWLVRAESRGTAVTVEAAVARRGRLVWEGLRGTLMDWIDGGAMPSIPAAPGREAFLAQLAADAALEQRLVAAQPELAGAVTAWRRASALRGLELLRPRQRPAYTGARPRLAASRVAIDGVAYDAIDDDETIELALDGDGVLELELRARGDLAIARDVAVAVRVGDYLVGHARARLGAAERAEPAAFPDPQPITDAEGRPVSYRLDLALGLLPGHHRYQIHVTGAPALVRARVARWRPTYLGTPPKAWPTLAARARAALGATRGYAADVLRARLAALDGGMLPRGGGLSGAVEAVRRGIIGAPALARRVHDAVREASAGGPAEHWLLGELTELLAARGHHALAADAAAVLARADAAHLRAIAAEHIAPGEVRSRAAGLAELADRAAPIDREVQRRARAVWLRRTAWRLVPPAPAAGDDAPPPRPAGAWVEWIEARPRARDSDGPGTGNLYPIPTDASVQVVAAPSALDPARPAVLELLVHDPGANGSPRRIALSVGAAGFRAHALSPVSRFEVAVAPGEHTLTIAPPPGATVLSSLPPVGATTAGRRALPRRYWPLAAAGAPVRYAIPDPDNPSPLRITVRRVGGRPASARVRLHSDVGPVRDLVVHTAGIDPHLLAIDDAALLSPAIDMVIPGVPGARALWLTADSDELVAAVFARADRGDPDDGDQVPSLRAPLPPEAAADPIERLAALSRAIAARPDDGTLLVRRAALLLDLGELGWARHDLWRLRTIARTDAERALTEQLEASVALSLAPTHIPSQAREALPLALSPNLVAGEAELPALVRAAAALRAGDRATAARVLAAAHLEGAPWQLGLEALRVARDELAHPPAGFAPLIYGLAARVGESVEHPAVRAARFAAARASTWVGLAGVDASAGYERLYTPLDANTTDAGRIEAALLAAPWTTGDAHMVRPGQHASLALELAAPTEVRAAALCRRLRTTATPRTGPCEIIVRADRAEVARHRVDIGRVTELPALALGAGRHAVELELDDADDSVTAALRVTTDRIDHARRPERSHRAEPGTPVRMTAVGPATLRLSLRGVGREPTLAAVTVRGPGAAIELSRIIDAAPDDAAVGDRGRGLVVTRPLELVLVLDRAGTHTIEIAPPRGAVLVRGSLRVDAAPTRARSLAWQRAVRRVEHDAGWPMPRAHLPIVDGLGPAARPWSGGTITGWIIAGRDGAEVVDPETRTIDARVEARVEWQRRAGDRTWLRASARTRVFFDADASVGIDAGVHRRGIPGGFYVDAETSVLGQNVATAVEGAVHGRVTLGRPLVLAPTWLLVPSVDARMRHYSRSTGSTTNPIDPLVFSTYGAAHRRVARGRATLYVRPYQDALVRGGAWVASNHDLAGVDHVGATVGVSLILPPSLLRGEVDLDYRPNLRLVDADRLRRVLRHDQRSRARWSLWSGDRGRFLVELQIDVTDARSAPQAAVAVGYQYFGGRGMTDATPADERFDYLLEPQLWDD